MQKDKSHFLSEFAVLRKTDLTVEELKMLVYLRLLSDGANCVNVNWEDLAATGLYSRKKQREVLKKLQDKNMVLPNTPETTQVIVKTICTDCPIERDSRECVCRSGRLFLNRDYKTWKGTTLNFNQKLIGDALEKNGMAVSFEKGMPSLNQRIASKAKPQTAADIAREMLSQDIFEE